MLPRNSVKPLELVISAIHCLKERRGSSPQDILKYLLGKYHVDPNSLRTHVQAGLKRGLSFGLITQKAGLYRLNDILSSPFDPPVSSKKPSKIKASTASRALKKQKIKKAAAKKAKRNFYQHIVGSFSQRGRRRIPRTREKKKPVRNRTFGVRRKNGLRRRKQKRQITKIDKIQKSKLEKPSKVKTEKVSEPIPPSTECPESKRSENAKESENVKNNVKT